MATKRPAAEKEIKRTMKEKRKLAKTQHRLKIGSSLASKKRNVCCSEDFHWKRQDFKINQVDDRNENLTEDDYFDF